MLNKVARKGPSRHHIDLLRVLGHALDLTEVHRVIKAVTPNVGVLKGIGKKLTAIDIRTLAIELNSKIKGITKATPLASGQVKAFNLKRQKKK